MKTLQKHRNIGIIAHIDAGKTTTTERILFYTGRIHRIGETHDGEGTMDWMEQEKERGITITSAATACEWDGHSINIIDTPGHVDFTIEVERSMRVLDGGVVILDASAGVEPQSETVWRQADKYGVPRLIYANKMTKMGADFEMSKKTVEDRLSKKVVAIQYPVGAENKFEGVIDLVEMVCYTFSGDKGENVHAGPVPAEYAAKAEEYRHILIERVAETDDALMEKYFAGEEITTEQLKKAIRQATINMQIFPMLAGDALANKGVQKVLDAVISYLPSPIDIPAIRGINPDTDQEVERPADDKAPMSAIAFKIATDPFVGKIVFIRVYSGVLTAGSGVYNSATGKTERVGRLLRMHANQREEIKELRAGDIGAAVGLKGITTGNTLCDEKSPVLLESIDFPEPVIRISIEPKTKNDQEKMATALQKLAEEDPTFKVNVDEETGQTIIAGMGELHLEIIVDRMRREFGVEANIGAPQVAYRETIQKTVECEEKYSKQTGGRGQYGHVKMILEPLEPGKGFEFSNEVVGGRIPKEFIPAVEKGVVESLTRGITAGYPIVDVRVRLMDGSYHDVDSSELSFKMAASIAFRDGARTANPVILEPIMAVEITTPEEYMGDIVGNVSSRRGIIREMIDRTGLKVIRCFVPLAELFGYSTDLRSMSQGRATYAMDLDHYDKVPANVAEKIRESRGK